MIKSAKTLHFKEQTEAGLIHSLAQNHLQTHVTSSKTSLKLLLRKSRTMSVHTKSGCHLQQNWEARNQSNWVNFPSLAHKQIQDNLHHLQGLDIMQIYLNLHLWFKTCLDRYKHLPRRKDRKEATCKWLNLKARRQCLQIRTCHRWRLKPAWAIGLPKRPQEK